MLTAERTNSPPAPRASAMPGDAELRRECEVFCRLLADRPPNDSVIGSYVRGHQRIPYLAAPGPTGGERLLLAVARWGRLPARLADTYSRFLHPISPLRQKLVLLLAILESTPPYHTRLNTAEVGSLAGVGARLVLRGLGFVALLVSSVVLLGLPDLIATLLHGPAPHE